MALWNLGTLMSEVTTRVGLRDDIAASTVSRLVNQAYYEVATLSEHRELENTTTYSITSGTTQVTLPADFLELVNVSLSTQSSATDLALDRTGIDFSDDDGYLPIGVPTRYVRWESTLRLHPSSDSDYSLRLRYRAYPELLTALTDVPSVGTEWQKAIMYSAEALVYERLGETDEAAAATARLFSYASVLKNSHHRDQAARSHKGLRVLRRQERY